MSVEREALLNDLTTLICAARDAGYWWRASVADREAAEMKLVAEIEERLRAALSRTEGERVEGCPACGGRIVQARPRYPRGEPRTVCPTCLADRIDNAREILDPRTYEAGQAPTGAKEG